MGIPRSECSKTNLLEEVAGRFESSVYRRIPKVTPALLVALSFCCCFASARVTSAEQNEPTDSRAEAGAHYQRGLAFVDQENWSEALREFEAAMSLDPHQATLFNLAQCLTLLGRHVEAARAFEDLIEQFGSDVSPERHREVEGQLGELAPRVARITPQVRGPESAVVLVDSEEHGVTPLVRPIVVGPGRHVVIVRAAGYLESRRELEVGGGQTAVVEVVMEPEPAGADEPPETPPLIPEDASDVAPSPVPPAEPPGAERGSSRASVIAGWLLVGVATLALGTSIGLFSAASSQFDTWDAESTRLGVVFAESSRPEDLEPYWGDVEANDDRQETIRTLDTAGWVLAGTGLASLVAAVAVLIVGYRPRPAQQVSLSPRPGGIAFGFSWGGPGR